MTRSRARGTATCARFPGPPAAPSKRSADRAEVRSADASLPEGGSRGGPIPTDLFWGSLKSIDESAR